MSDERHETVADIVTEMRKRAEEVYVGQSGYPESWKDQMDYGEIYELADRIEAANKRENEATIEKSSAVGNAAAMREALVMAKRLFDGRLMWQQDIRKAHEAVNAALSKPPRNCDRPECATTNAAQDTWRKEDGGKTAYYEWLFAEAKGWRN